MEVVGGVCCGESGFWLFFMGKREIHTEKERGRKRAEEMKFGIKKN